MDVKTVILSMCAQGFEPKTAEMHHSHTTACMKTLSKHYLTGNTNRANSFN